MTGPAGRRQARRTSRSTRTDPPARSVRLGAALRSVPRQARADLWPLLVTVAVVAMLVAICDASPRLLTATADSAVHEAIASATYNDLTVTAPFQDDDFRSSSLPPTVSSASVKYTAVHIDQSLPVDLAPLFAAPVVTVATISLPLVVPDSLESTLRLAYVWDGAEAAVDWAEGGPPAATRASKPRSYGTVWPVQVAVSTTTAALLRVGVGDRLNASDKNHGPLDVTVSGIFRPSDAGDPVWRQAPELLSPRIQGSGLNARTVVAAYLSAESLPDARLALEPHDTATTYTFAVHSSAVRYEHLDTIVAHLSKLEANPASLGLSGDGYRVTTSLDRTLVTEQARIVAAGSQAAVLLVGLIAAGAAVLALAASVVVRRRAAVLTQHRARGASLPAIATALGVESLALAAAGGALGLLLAALAVPGRPSWPWPVPVLAVAVLAGPVLGSLTARASDGRRRPADRRQRRAAGRVQAVRRTALEAGVALLGVAGLAALRSRGVTAGTGAGADLLLSGAPTLVAVAGAALSYRALPAVLGGLLAVSRRARGAAPMLAAARARAASAAALPFIALVVATTLLTFAATLAQTIRSGQVSGSWDSVGADVRIHVETDPDAAATTLLLGKADGVTLATAARVEDNIQLSGLTGRHDQVRVVAVDPAAFERLLAATPLEDGPQLAALVDPPALGAPTPALVSPGLSGPAGQLSLRWQEQSAPITSVGVAPDLGAALNESLDAETVRETVIVSAQALAAAIGVPVDANMVWVIGPGADAAVAATPGWAGATVISRAQWLTARSSEPLTAGLVRLTVASIALLVAAAAVTVVLAASASAPGRATTLAALRVLGLRRRAANAVALGELAPSILAACLSGLLLGVLLAASLVSTLALNLITGQSATPVLTVPWWTFAPLGVIAGAAALVVAVESSVRRRERLGQVLRVGSS